MLVDRIIVVLSWAYALAIAVLLGVGIPGQVEAMAISTDGIPLGISLIFWIIPLILFVGFALARWDTEIAMPSTGFLVERFGEQRVASLIRSLRPKFLLMIGTGTSGVLGVGITLATHRLAIALCLSSYFLAVGAGNLVAWLTRHRRREP